MSETANRALLECFEDAAMQAWLMAPRVYEVRMQQPAGNHGVAEDYQGVGWDFSYAVDANIFTAYVDAVTNYSSAKMPPGRVFRTDDDEREKQIAANLLNFIWTVLTPQRPLLVLPPIDREVLGAVESVMARYRSARRQSIELRASEVDSTLKAILARAAKESHDLTPAEVEEIRQALLLDPREFPAARRMRELFDQKRMTSSGAPLDRTQFSLAMRDALGPAADHAEAVTFSEMKRNWMRRLSGIGRPVSDRSERDAEALARLEMCNKRLAASKVRERLVYITLDNSIIEAGEGYIWPYEEPERLGIAPEGPPTVFGRPPISFTGLFIRHPRAYLNEESVMRAPAPRESSGEAEGPSNEVDLRSLGLDGWLTVWLGLLVDYGPIPPPRSGKMTLTPSMVEELRRRAASSSGKDGSAGDVDAVRKKIIDEWSAFEAAASRDVPESYSNLIRRQLRLVDGGQGEDCFFKRLGIIRQGFARELNEHFEQVIRATIQARFVFQVGDIDAIPAREVAPLYFENRPRLIAFMSAAHRWLRRQNGGRPEPFSLATYQELRMSVQEEGDPDQRRSDPTGYGDYLAHAHIFALMGQWTTAAVLARRARERAIPKVENALGPNGREAYFFEAFCKRYSARSPRDLIGLDDLLAEALEIVKREMACVHDDRSVHDPVEERFTAERFALKISQGLFTWYRAPEAEKRIALHEMSGLIGEMLQLRDACDKRHENLRKEFDRLGEGHESSGIIRHRLDCLWRVATRQTRNILAIGLLDPTQLSRAGQAWEWLEIHRDNPHASHESDGQNDSQLARILSKCATAHFAEKTEERDRARQELRRELSSLRGGPGRADSNLSHVLPYDRERFEQIIELAISAGTRR